MVAKLWSSMILFICGALFTAMAHATFSSVPSQLYEALLEGLVLFLVLYFLRRNVALRRRTGLLTGAFFIGYGLARSVAELFRQPDYHIGFLLGGTTMGQWLSAPLILFGIWLIVRAKPGT